MLTRVSPGVWEFPDHNVRIHARGDGSFLAVRRSGGPGYPAGTWIGAFNIGRKLYTDPNPIYTPKARPQPKALKMSPEECMSPRERQTLALLVEAKSDKEIALDLGISVLTAKQYVAGIINKLGVKNRTAAAVWGARNATAPAHDASGARSSIRALSL